MIKKGSLFMRGFKVSLNVLIFLYEISKTGIEKSLLCRVDNKYFRLCKTQLSVTSFVMVSLWSWIFILLLASLPTLQWTKLCSIKSFNSGSREIVQRAGVHALHVGISGSISNTKLSPKNWREEIPSTTGHGPKIRKEKRRENPTLVHHYSYSNLV